MKKILIVAAVSCLLFGCENSKPSASSAPASPPSAAPSAQPSAQTPPPAQTPTLSPAPSPAPSAPASQASPQEVQPPIPVPAATPKSIPTTPAVPAKTPAPVSYPFSVSNSGYVNASSRSNYAIKGKGTPGEMVFIMGGRAMNGLASNEQPPNNRIVYHYTTETDWAHKTPNAVVGNDGTFSFPVNWSALKDGDWEFGFYAYEKGGAKTGEFGVTLTIDTIANCLHNLEDHDFISNANSQNNYQALFPADGQPEPYGSKIERQPYTGEIILVQNGKSKIFTYSSNDVTSGYYPVNVSDFSDGAISATDTCYDPAGNKHETRGVVNKTSK